MRAILRFVLFLLRTVVLVAALALGFVGANGLAVERVGAPAAAVLAGSGVLLIVWWKLRRRAVTKGAPVVPATIVRIWQDPPAGAPGIYWTWVLFDARGERARVRLTKSQARHFLRHHGPGDVGRVAWRGAKLLRWQPATADSPARRTPVSAFISYERSWSDDARYVAQFLRSRGIDAWIDSEELQAGDELAKGVAEAIARADVFVPLLSRTYWTSAWCLRELEVARKKGVVIRPVKVEEGRLVPPPHMRETATTILDQAVYVDLRGRDPITQLDDLATSLAGGR